MDNRVPLVQQARQAPRETLEILAQLDLKVGPEQVEHLDQVERLEPRDQQGHRELQEVQEPQEDRERVVHQEL